MPATLAPEAPPVPRPAPRLLSPPPAEAEGTTSSVTPRPTQEATRILSEAEVFVKYGLLERAVDHLRRLLEREPNHAEARARLDTVPQASSGTRRTRPLIRSPTSRRRRP